MTVKATNCNRAAVARDLSLAADGDSQVIDFADMSTGGIQVLWAGNGVENLATFEIFVSFFPEINTMCRYVGSLYQMDPALVGVFWNLGVVGFRYAILRQKANGQTAGTYSVYASGKKGGGAGF